jgi:colanic acid biosynthesis glycosyl transferase WcaI
VARVLFLTLVFPPDSVSTAEIMGDLALELRSRGHDVTVVTTVPHYNRDPDADRRQPVRRVWGPLLGRSDYGGVPVFHTAMPAKTPGVLRRIAAWAGFHAISTIAALTIVERPDVILAPSPPLSIGVSAWIVARLRGARYIYNVQEIYPDIAINLGAVKNRAIISALHALERFVYRGAAAVTVIAARMRDRLVAKGVPAARVHVIPNFVDLDRLAPAPRHNEFSARHGLDEGLIVTYAGNMGPAQGLETVIDAARLIGDRLPVRFVLIGEGGQRASLTALAAALPHPSVAVLPYQPSSLMPQIYGASDVSLVPLAASTGSDAIPSKVYRIMASGRPLIAVAEADSDLAVLVREAGCGRAVAPADPAALADAVADAAAHPDAWRAMGERGRAHVVAHYTRAVVTAQYDALIRRVHEHAVA